jgi:hypothetical protein
MSDPMTADERRARALDKIRKVLAMAEGAGTTQPERDAFNAKAAAMIAEFGVVEAELAEALPIHLRASVGDRIVTVPGPYALDKVSLLNQIVVALGGRAILLRGEGAGKRLHLFGYDTDLDRIEVLWTSLLVQASFGLASVSIPFGVHVAAYRRSFMSGFTAAISQRLTAAERAAKVEAAPGTALVLVRRSGEVAHAVTAQYPSTISHTRRLSGGGRHAGYAAGQRANLGGTAVGGGGGPGITR